MIVKLIVIAIASVRIYEVLADNTSTIHYLLTINSPLICQ